VLPPSARVPARRPVPTGRSFQNLSPLTPYARLSGHPRASTYTSTLLS
jgi:hypothetical protein